jgi:hypothetical protein
LGSGGNTFFINGTAVPTATFLNSGTGADTVDVLATGGPTTFNTGGGANVNTVNVGSVQPPAPNYAPTPNNGNVNNIQGALTVLGNLNDTMNVDDSGSRIAKVGTLTPTTLTGMGMGPSGITYSGLANLNVRFGSMATLTSPLSGNTLYINGINPLTHTAADGGTDSVADDDAVYVANAANSTNFNGTLDLTRWESASVTVAGSYTGTINIDTDPGDGPVIVNPVTIGGSMTSTGVLNVGGDVGTMTVGGDVAGTVTASGTITTASVGGNLSGSVSETGTVNQITIGGSLTPTGVINAVNTTNPPSGNINTLTIGQDLAGTVNVSGTIHHLNISNGSITSTASLTLGNLDSFVVGPNHLSVGQNMAGTLTVTGNLGSVQVAGGIPGWIKAGHIGTIAAYGGYGPVVLRVTENGIERRVEEAVPTMPCVLPDPAAVASDPYVNVQFFYEGTLPGASGMLANPQLTARITNNVSTAADQYDLSLVTYNDTAKFNLARLDTPSYGLTGATTKGSTTVSVASKRGLAVGQAVSGPGIPAGTTIVAISNTANSITLSSAATATASNVALSYTVASGARNVAVEGDLLTSVTATAQAFLSLPSTAGGLSLPADALAGVGVRDFIPNSSIQADSIQAVAFGSHAEEDGNIFTGAASQGEDAQDMLVTGTALVQANDTFRAPFADLATQQAQLFVVTDPKGGSFDDKGLVLTVQSVTSPNAAGTANIVTPSNVARGAVTALIKLVPTYDSNGTLQKSVVQSVDLRGDGGSLQTQQSFSATASITSTGPLGDLNLQESQGLNSLTAPSIFGSITLNGPITGIAQTTGLRTDPITCQVSSVPADWGRVYVTQTSSGPALTASTVVTIGVGLTGSLISRGNLISQIIANGSVKGLVAVQGDLGTQVGSTRLGGLSWTGGFSGQVVTLGDIRGDVAISGSLTGARIAVKGSVRGNMSLSGSLDAKSAVVAAGGIGDAAAGTTLSVTGTVSGIVGAEGAINLSKAVNLAPGSFFRGNLKATPSASAIDAIFTNGGLPLSFDINSLDLAGLSLILTHLSALHVGSDGNLTGTTP